MLATPRLRKHAGFLAIPARLLYESIPRVDLHLHTDYTDGKSSIREMFTAARREELEIIGFTEHVRRGIDWFQGFQHAVSMERSEFAEIGVVVGIEAKALDCRGTLDADPEIIAQADIILGAVHGFSDMSGGFFDPMDYETAALIEYEMAMGLLEHSEIDILAHPGGLTTQRFGGYPATYLREIIQKAAETGHAIELNGEYFSSEQLLMVIEECRRVNAWITLGSNAHHADEVGRIYSRIREVLNAN